MKSNAMRAALTGALLLVGAFTRTALATPVMLVQLVDRLGQGSRVSHERL
jgi:hypothetical protein